jgi:hypothetical protein
MNNLRNLIVELESLEATRPSGEPSSIFVEVRKNDIETIIAGNQDGLVHIALQLLRLAESKALGGHYHVDESSIADTAETNVVFSYKQAPWA